MNEFKKFWKHEANIESVSGLIQEYARRREEVGDDENSEETVYAVVLASIESKMGYFLVPNEYLYNDSPFCQFMEAVMDGDAQSAVALARKLAA